jgi:hypothetical protein
MQASRQVELATAEWVDWWNQRRLHSADGDLPPAESPWVSWRLWAALGSVEPDYLSRIRNHETALANVNDAENAMRDTVASFVESDRLSRKMSGRPRGRS